MIGERIKETRGRNGMTQSELAKKLGISRSAVNAWEMGISIPSAQYLIELSNQFNVSVDYLLERNTQEMVDISFLSEEEKHIIYVFLDYFKKYENTMQALKEQEEQLPPLNFGVGYEKTKSRPPVQKDESSLW